MVSTVRLVSTTSDVDKNLLVTPVLAFPFCFGRHKTGVPETKTRVVPVPTLSFPSRCKTEVKTKKRGLLKHYRKLKGRGHDDVCLCGKIRIGSTTISTTVGTVYRGE